MGEKFTMRISIVTVTYNAEAVIKKTLISVLEQSYSNIEYIIKDGGSTDNTNRIIDSYKKFFKEKGILLIHIIEADTGIYNAMNIATKYCLGKWVIYLNAGDRLYDNNTLQKYINKISSSDGDVYYGDSISIYNNKQILCIHNDKDLLKRMALCHQACCIRTEIAKEIGYDEKYCIGADYDFFLKLFLREYRFVKLPYILCYFGKEGVSSRELVKSYREFIDIKIKNKIKVPNIFFVSIKVIIKKIREVFKIY